MTYRQTDRPHGRTDGQWETDRQTYWQTDKQTQTDGKQTDGLADRQTRQRSTNYRTAWLIDRSAQKILQRNLLQIPLSMQKYRFVSLTWRLWKNENPVIAGVTFLTKLAIALKTKYRAYASLQSKGFLRKLSSLTSWSQLRHNLISMEK